MSGDFPARSEFRELLAMPTRWMDQDPYGHVNNVEYYSFFDTVVAEHLIREAQLNVVTTREIALVVETKCRFLKEISFPQVVHAGMRIPKMGNSAITYEIALYRDAEEDCAAFGHFVHVYIDRETRQTVRVPDRVRNAVQRFVVT